MAYVRKRGKQLVIVQGERDPEKGKVQQRILFTIYSKAEALRILGRSGGNGDAQFRALVERQYPEITFNWDALHSAIAENMGVLPDLHEYKTMRIRSQFRVDLCAFTRQLILADPQDLFEAGKLIEEHCTELEYLADLIQWRLKLRTQAPDQWNADNPFYWRFTLQGTGVPPDVEEHVASFYEKGEYDRARALFRLLTECFAGYAEGYNYLGLISLHHEELEEAMAHFQKTVEVGRKQFPKRIARSRYWNDLSTRPYMRGLMNLTLTLNRAGRYEEALAYCDRLENECGDSITPHLYRAMVYLNTGRYHEAADSALRLHKLYPSESLIASLALHELGKVDHALASFLHGALNFPRAAGILVGSRAKTPKSYGEAQDHNTGIDLLKNVSEYLRGRGRRTRRFFRSVFNDSQVASLLEEMDKVTKRWHDQPRTDDRDAFDRMRQMQAPEFARQEATKLVKKTLRR